MRMACNNVFVTTRAVLTARPFPLYFILRHSTTFSIDKTPGAVDNETNHSAFMAELSRRLQFFMSRRNGRRFDVLFVVFPALNGIGELMESSVSKA
jgi:hypothetical protein